MAEAKVRFFDELGREVESDAATTFGFDCPKGRGLCSGLLIAGRTDQKRDGQNQNGGVAMWDFDGNAAAPTFKPSINCKRCWHGYIRNGRTVDCKGNDEPAPVKV